MKGIIKEPEFNGTGGRNSTGWQVDKNNPLIDRFLFDDLGSNRSSYRSSVSYKGADLNDVLANISSSIRARMSTINAATGYSIDEFSAWDESKIAKVILIQSITRKWILRRGFKKVLEKARYRLKVIQELIITEEKYVKNLVLLHDKVYLPLKLHCSLSVAERKLSNEYQSLSPSMQAELSDVQLKETEVQALFSNLEEIISLNSRFCHTMQERQKELTISGLFADVCVEFAPLLKIYVIYLNNFDQSNKTLINLTNSQESFKSFRSFLEDEELNGLDIADYLIKPVQRLPKYSLLLKDMLRNTLVSHRDHKNVQTALDTFGEVCSHNNEEMDRFIRENKLVELNRRFCKPIGAAMMMQGKSERQSSGLNRILPFQQISSVLRGSLNAFSQTIFRNKDSKSKGGQTIENDEIPFLLDHANEGLVILEPNVTRTFLWEEQMSLFSNNSAKRVTVYFISDLLLVTSKEGQGDKSYEILLKFLYLNEASFLKNMTDLKYFSNLFRVIGKSESLTFITDTDEMKSILIQRINKQILIPLKLKIHQKAQAEKLQKQKQSQDESSNLSLRKQATLEQQQNGTDSSNLENSNANTEVAAVNLDGIGLDMLQPISVEVIGTEERMSSNMLKLKEKYTVYITKVQIGDHVQKIFIRYKEMIEVEKYVKKHIKEIKDIPHLSKSIFHGTKVIEQRKLLIENFLQLVLSNQYLRSHPKRSDLLSFIGLPDNFFSLSSSSGGEMMNVEYEIEQNLSSSIGLPHGMSYYNENQEDSDHEEDHLKYEKGVEGLENSSKGLSQSVNLQSAANRNSSSVTASQIYGLNSSKNTGKTGVAANNSQALLISQTLGEQRSLSGSGENEESQDPLSQSIRIRSQKVNASKDFRDSFGMNNKQASVSESEREIEISVLTGQTIKLNINKNSKALDVCMAIAADLNLQSYLDFRILAEDEKKNNRILDDDELVYKLVFPSDFNSEVETKEASKFNLSGLKKAVLNKLSIGKSGQKVKLSFIKYLWLEQYLEESDCRDDPVRLSLITAQVFNEISSLKFTLTQVQEYYFYSALNILINHQKTLETLLLPTTPQKNKHTFIWNVQKTFLPSSILRLSKENIWVESLLIVIESLSDELARAVQATTEIISQAAHDQFKSDIVSEKRSIACLLLLKHFKMNPFYGASLFPCETYKKTIKDAKAAGLKIPEKVVCSIKCDAIQILDVSKQNRIKTIKYQEIKETKVFPSSITFVLFNSSHSYRFDSAQSFEISQLMIAYHHLMSSIQKKTLSLDAETNETQKN